MAILGSKKRLGVAYACGRSEGVWLVRDIHVGQAEFPYFVVKRTKIVWKEKWHGLIPSFGWCFWQWEEKKRQARPEALGLLEKF